MGLVFEDRDALRSGPGLHAFIVGVSRYAHLPNGGGTPAVDSFGLEQLTSTALSAYRVYQWLLANRSLLPCRLATVHLLLSPSDAERAIEPGLDNVGDPPGRPEPARRRAFSADARSWRTRARASDREFTFFYFAGHGLARDKGDSVLLCEDFGDPDEGSLLHNAIDHDHLFNGMAPPKRVTEAMARRQVYFVDACRTDVPDARVARPTVPDLWPIDLGGQDNRQAPVFFGAIPGTQAMALDSGQTLFSQALLACLDHDALRPLEELQANGEPRYGATVDALNSMLKLRLDALNVQHGTSQKHDLTGHVSNLTLRYVEGRPAVTVLVEVDPAADAGSVAYDVQDAQGGAVFTAPSLAAHPFSHQLPAGMYRFAASVSNPKPSHVPFAAFGQVLPPFFPLRARVRQ